MNWATKILLAVGLPAFAVFLYLKLEVEHIYPISAAIGEAVGATLIPLVIALVWNGMAARAERRKIGPGAKPGVAWGAVMTAWLIIGASIFGNIAWEREKAERAAAAVVPHSYQGPGCDLGVVFPGVPTIRPVTIEAEGMSGEQAELLLSDSYLRVECVRYPATLSFSPDQADLYIRNYIAQQGLSDAVFLPQDQSQGLAVGARGNKAIDGAGLITYEATMIFRRGSMLALVTASRASLYPTPSIEAFRRSVRVSP